MDRSWPGARSSNGHQRQRIRAGGLAGNRFTGTLKKVVIDSAPAELSAAEQGKLQTAERATQLTRE